MVAVADVEGRFIVELARHLSIKSAVGTGDAGRGLDVVPLFVADIVLASGEGYSKDSLGREFL